MHEELLIKVRNVLMLCDPAVRARMHLQANSLESQAFNLVGEIDAALSAQPDEVARGGGAHKLEITDECGRPMRYWGGKAARPDAGSGGDALARALSVFERRRGDIPFEVYEAFQELRAAIAARQPVGAEPVAHVPIHPRNGPLWSDTYAAGDAADGRSPSYARMPLYTAPPAPAAVPVDGRQDAAIIEAAKLAYGLLWMGSDLSGPDLARRARVPLRDALGKQACGEGINAARTTHPQPAADRGDA